MDIRIPITTVGSRELLVDSVYDKLMLVGMRIVEAKGRVREGNALGSDNAFQTGAFHAAKKYNIPTNEVCETFLHQIKTKDGTEHNPEIGVYSLPKLPHADLAYSIAKLIHPAWEKCNDVAKALHARNCYQVMGPDLLTPSNQLFCYAPPTPEGSVVGGTRTAFELARRLGIPTTNFYMKKDVEKNIEEGSFNIELAKQYFPSRGHMLLDVPNLAQIDDYLMNIIRDYGLVNPTFLKKFKEVYQVLS